MRENQMNARKPMDTVEALRAYNRWRRCENDDAEEAGPHPKEIGEQIDAAIYELEALRKFHEFFRDNCEWLFFHFGMPAIDLYNQAAATRRGKTPNVEVTGTAAALSPQGPRGPQG